MRPRGIRVVTWVLLSMALSGLAFRPSGVAPSIWWALYWTTPVLSGLVVWQFWRGKNWARLLILWTALLVIPGNLLLLLSPRHFFLVTFPGWRVVLVVEALFGLYLQYWLRTSRVVKFFPPMPRGALGIDLPPDALERRTRPDDAPLHIETMGIRQGG